MLLIPNMENWTTKSTHFLPTIFFPFDLNRRNITKRWWLINDYISLILSNTSNNSMQNRQLAKTNRVKSKEKSNSQTIHTITDGTTSTSSFHAVSTGPTSYLPSHAVPNTPRHPPSLSLYKYPHHSPRFSIKNQNKQFQLLHISSLSLSLQQKQRKKKKEALKERKTESFVVFDNAKKRNEERVFQISFTFT